MSKQSLAEYVNQIQAAGRYTFTTVEAQKVTELSQDALIEWPAWLRGVGHMGNVGSKLVSLFGKQSAIQSYHNSNTC